MTVTAPDRTNQRRYALTEYGNGERLVHEHGGSLHWVTAWKSWLVWDGRRWKRDDACLVERYAKQTVRHMWQDVATVDDGDFREALKKHAFQSESMGKVRAMIEHAKSEPGVAAPYESFDQRPMLLNVLNGTWDLERQLLREHDPEDRMTKLSPVAFEPAATCPRWERFLEEIFDRDADLIAYVQRAIGYSLTGDTREQCFHLLHGSGSNGKTTFLEVLASLMGEYGVQADFSTFLDKTGDGPRNDVARLAGARMVRSEEVGEAKKLNEALIKSLTGTSMIAARFLYSEAFEFAPTFKLWLAANHKPIIRGTDYAIWRRVRLIPFLVQFRDDQKDDTLRDTLRMELPGILNWCLRGAAEWLENGLKPPAIVNMFTDQYRTESDVIGAFIEECCTPEPSEREKSADLYHAYKRWAEETGEYVLSLTGFGRRLEERGVHMMKSMGLKYRKGLKLKPEASRHSEGGSWFNS